MHGAPQHCAQRLGWRVIYKVPIHADNLVAGHDGELDVVEAVEHVVDLPIEGAVEGVVARQVDVGHLGDEEARVPQLRRQAVLPRA